jgi:hypothetical protein
MKTVFLRALEELHDKESALQEAINAGDAARGRQRFDVDPESFATVPGSPFAYWVSDRLRALFSELPLFESEGRVAKRGVNSNDDQRFLRLAWECRGSQWALHVKGGVWSPYYADPHLLLKWGSDGRELQAERVTSRIYKFAIVPSRELYFRPGLTWPLRTKSDLSLRVMPAGCVFGSKGPAIIVDGNNHDELLCLLAIGNSQAFRSLVEFQLAAADAKAGGAARSYEVGVLQRTPLPRLTEASRGILAQLAGSAWSLRRSLDTATETSHAFTLPALLQVPGAKLSTRAAAWRERTRSVNLELAAIQTRVDERCFKVYGISDFDRQTITAGFGAAPSEAAPNEATDEIDDEGEEDGGKDSAYADDKSLAAELFSWAIGVACGRFDIRLATGERPMPAESEPFDPLPTCSPGMLTNEDGLPLARPPANCPISFPDTGVLVDDLGHAQDLPTAVRAVFGAIFGNRADRWWDDVAAPLDPKGHDLRVWLSSNFFEHHLQRYSKSRRKAPILWQLGTPSGHYSVWLYAHRLTQDSFFKLQNEVVGPKLTHEEAQLARLIENAGASPSATERKEIVKKEALVEELRTMLDEVKRVAPLWNPDLEDGVVIVMAPLWRLVPQFKPWQMELQSKWEELVAEKYDWAHLAMHLWPERVVPKCATDRSLAITHGLEDVFWVEAANGKWMARPTPVRSIEELVRERSSPAVKAALKSLLEAPTASGAGRASGRRRASSAEGGSR